MCERVCRHMVTTGLEASLPHQNSLTGSMTGMGGLPAQPDVELFFFFIAKREGTAQRMKTKDVNALSVCTGRLTHTSGAVGAGDVAPRTGAHVAAGCVGALASVAHAGDGAAFVDIWEEHRATCQKTKQNCKTVVHVHHRPQPGSFICLITRAPFVCLDFISPHYVTLKPCL